MSADSSKPIEYKMWVFTNISCKALSFRTHNTQKHALLLHIVSPYSVVLNSRWNNMNFTLMFDTLFFHNNTGSIKMLHIFVGSSSVFISPHSVHLFELNTKITKTTFLLLMNASPWIQELSFDIFIQFKDVSLSNTFNSISIAFMCAKLSWALLFLALPWTTYYESLKMQLQWFNLLLFAWYTVYLELIRVEYIS